MADQSSKDKYRKVRDAMRRAAYASTYLEAPHTSLGADLRKNLETALGNLLSIEKSEIKDREELARLNDRLREHRKVLMLARAHISGNAGLSKEEIDEQIREVLCPEQHKSAPKKPFATHEIQSVYMFSHEGNFTLKREAEVPTEFLFEPAKYRSKYHVTVENQSDGILTAEVLVDGRVVTSYALAPHSTASITPPYISGPYFIKPDDVFAIRVGGKCVVYVTATVGDGVMKYASPAPSTVVTDSFPQNCGDFEFTVRRNRTVTRFLEDHRLIWIRRLVFTNSGSSPVDFELRIRGAVVLSGSVPGGTHYDWSEGSLLSALVVRPGDLVEVDISGTCSWSLAGTAEAFKKKLIPWTIDTCPNGPIWVRASWGKDVRSWGSVIAVEEAGLRFTFGVLEWKYLSTDYVWSPDRSDERPCGTEVES